MYLLVIFYCFWSVSISLFNRMDCTIGLENKKRRLYSYCSWSHCKALVFCTVHCSVSWRRRWQSYTAFAKCYCHHVNTVAGHSFYLEYFQVELLFKVEAFWILKTLFYSVFILGKEINTQILHMLVQSTFDVIITVNGQHRVKLNNLCHCDGHLESNNWICTIFWIIFVLSVTGKSALIYHFVHNDISFQMTMIDFNLIIFELW